VILSLEPPKRFFRSVRISEDLADSEALRGYVITPQVRQVLSRLAVGLQPGATDRAWTLTGPYGSGKSAFTLFVAQLLRHPNPPDNPAWQALKQHDPDLAERFFAITSGHALQPIPLTLRRASLGRSVLEGLHAWLESLPVQSQTQPAKNLALELELDLQLEQLDTRKVTNRVRAALEYACNLEACGGLFLIFDELGKALEYAARQPSEDIYLLQELTELASRSGERQLLIVGALHQAFECYAESLELSARREWGKIQGRFVDIAFLEPPAQQMWLAARALKSLEWPGQAAQRDVTHRVANDLFEAGVVASGFESHVFADLAAEAYPLHPTVLAALPHVFRRFAQNERSLFAYLASHEPFAPLERFQARGPGFVRLPDLFDYVQTAFGGNLSRHATAKRWLEITDSIERQPGLEALEVATLKTVGLLNILGDTSALRATAAVVALALNDRADDAEVRGALERLMERSTLTYRRSTESYRIFEGSDVDVEARLDEGRRVTETHTGLAATLRDYLSLRPLVARRHSHQTGALRFFELRYLDEPSNELSLKPGADGVVVCCLPANLAAAQVFTAWAEHPVLAGSLDTIVVIPQQIGTIREACHELRALHWVQQNTPELRDDRVARREVANRIAAVERSLALSVERMLNPAPAPSGSGALWYHRGVAQPTTQPRGVAQLLSQVMDELYPHTPRLHNELINRRSLSSAATAARNALIGRMLEFADQAQLAIEGYPPERSMYESVLRATGLHRETGAGKWGFFAPDEGSHLRAAWLELERRVFAALTEPEALNKLFDHLSRPPFGVMPGVLPVLLAALLLARPNEISLYREGTFLSELSASDFEVLVRRPELFSIAGGQVSGERVAVVQRLASSLGTAPATMPIVRALMKMVRSLPDYAWRTSSLPATVQAARVAFEQARSPERLLYHELPLALNQMPFQDHGEADAARVERFFTALNAVLQDWANAYPALLKGARDQFLIACELPTGDEGWTALRVQARKLEGSVTHSSLVPIIKRLAAHGDERSSLEGVLALVLNRPPKNWSDADTERYPAQVELIGKLMRESRYTNGVLSKAETAESNKLYKRLKSELLNSTPSHVLRAALSKLLQELL
jgi:hypothetical protein